MFREDAPTMYKSNPTLDPVLTRKEWLIARLLFVITLFAYALFLQDPFNSNSSSRMFLSYALAEDRSLSIDSYANLTIDRAEYEGHFYSDKAPGLSVLALPAVMLAEWPAARWAASHSEEEGRDNWPAGYVVSAYAATISTSGLLTALSVAALFLVATSLLGSLQTATLVALVYGLATPAFGWATAFFGHASAMALCVLGFAALHFLSLATTLTRREYVLACSAAIFLAAATLTEFTAAPAAFLIAVYAVQRTSLPVRDILRLGLVALFMVIVMVVPLLMYNQAAFGSPLHLGYASVQDFPGMKRGFFGLTSPTADALWGILVGPQRGIIWICPLLVMLPVGVWRMLSAPALRNAGLLCLLVIGYYILLNSSYHYWNGGWSTGPRHVTAMLPFACLAIGAAWQRGSVGFRVLAAVLTVASLALALICTTVGMFAPESEPQLVLGYLIPGLLNGLSTAAPVKLGLLASHYFYILWVLAAILVSAFLYRIVKAPGATRDATA